VIGMTSKSLIDKFIETDAEEALRLSQAPVGSQSHELSKLPVRVKGWPGDGRLIMLPRLGHSARTMIVLPLKFHRSTSHAERVAAGGKHLHDGVWDCKVVQSNHPSYPVGGYDIVCSESELRRGAPVRLAFVYDEVFDQHDQGAIRA